MEKNILTVNGFGIDIRVNGGQLKIKDGFMFEGGQRETNICRGLNDIDHIVIFGQTGNISFDALKWIIDQKVMVTMLDPDGNVITRFMPESHISGITKRRQATAGDNINMKISSWLLSEKFRGQRNTLNYIQNTFFKTKWWNSERDFRIGQAISISSDREKALPSCLNADSQRVLEAQSAAAYWHCFEGIPITWDKAKKIPVNWLAIRNRTSPKTSSPRKAVEPFNAGLNYLYTVLETKVRNTCIINSVDPDFGIIHADHSNRTSLVFDLMEPIRPKVDQVFLNWFLSQTFNTKDFFETREGVCRISQEIISKIIPLVNSFNLDITKVVKEFAEFFKNKTVIEKPDEFKDTRKTKGIRKLKDNPKKSKQVNFNFEKAEIESDIPNAVKNKPAYQNEKNTETISAETFCLECGEAIIPSKPGKKFCCDKHKHTYRKRKLREKRIAEGNCPQCGRPMPESANGTYKEKLTYCQHCMEYWKKRYKLKKENSC